MRRDHPWWPALDDIQYHYSLLDQTQLLLISPAAYRATLLLVSACAAKMVDLQFSDANGGLVRARGDKDLASITRTPLATWKKIRSEVLQFFVEEDGHYRIADPTWVFVRGRERPAIPASIRSSVMRRDDWTCVYCGTREGPFDLDHVVPYSEGGDLVSEDNLVCACGPCNKRKRARTPKQWIVGED